MVIVIRICLLQLPMLLQLLLLEHLCNLIEEFFYVLPCLGRNAEIWHLIFLNEELQSFFLECSK